MIMITMNHYYYYYYYYYQHQCCGVQSFSDWAGSPWQVLHNHPRHRHHVHDHRRHHCQCHHHRHYFHHGLQANPNMTNSHHGEYVGNDNGGIQSINHLQMDVFFSSIYDLKFIQVEHQELKVPDSCCKTVKLNVFLHPVIFSIFQVSKDCGWRDHPSNIHYTGCIHR